MLPLIEASLSESVKFSAPMKKELIRELRTWNLNSWEELIPESLVLSDEKILENFDRYELQNYSIIMFKNKMNALLPYYSSTYCLAYPGYVFLRDKKYGFQSYESFNIPEREKGKLISIFGLIFSISFFTLVLRNYKRKTIWGALFCGVVLFFLNIFLWTYLDEQDIIIYYNDEPFLAASHFTILVLCTPILLRAYFLKRNPRITNVILLIPIVYLFTIYFLWSGVSYFEPARIDLAWQILSLGGSIIFGLAYFHALVKINRLPV